LNSSNFMNCDMHCCYGGSKEFDTISKIGETKECNSSENKVQEIDQRCPILLEEVNRFEKVLVLSKASASCQKVSAKE